MGTPRRRRTWWWLVVAALLAVGGAWLMFSTDPAIPEERSVSLPTSMRPQEHERATQRRTIIELPPLDDAGLPTAPPPPPRDPVMALMPRTVKSVAMVAEFSALVNSDLGGLMMQCLFNGDDGLLQALRDAGVDPATSIDRVAFLDDTLVLTGNFKGDRWRSLASTPPAARDWGRRGKVYEWPLPDGGTSVVGSWGEQLIVTGATREDVQAALDKLEVQGPHEPGALKEDDAYGEVYGVIGPEAIAALVATQDEGLARTIGQAAKGVTLHVDAQHDVGLVADVQGTDPAKQEELRRALGGALSLARVQAQAGGHSEEAALLDEARVTASNGQQFRLSAGLPYEYMQKVFRDCVARKRADAGAP